MSAKRYLPIAVFGATILFFVFLQTTAAKPPEKPGNPGVPGLLAEISRLQAIIDEHYPEISDEWNDVQADIEDTMDQIHELKEANRPEKPDFENMTEEEIEAHKAEMEAKRAERKASREERQAEREAGKEEREEKRAAFETALEEGDTDAIKAFIDEALKHMTERLENAQERLAEMESAE